MSSFLERMNKFFKETVFKWYGTNVPMLTDVSFLVGRFIPTLTDASFLVGTFIPPFTGVFFVRNACLRVIKSNRVSAKLDI
jgi:hypothetical protein